MGSGASVGAPQDESWNEYKASNGRLIAEDYAEPGGPYSLCFDTKGNGKIDRIEKYGERGFGTDLLTTLLLDENHDGIFDKVIQDTTGDGKPDTVMERELGRSGLRTVVSPRLGEINSKLARRATLVAIQSSVPKAVESLRWGDAQPRSEVVYRGQMYRKSLAALGTLPQDIDPTSPLFRRQASDATPKHCATQRVLTSGSG